MKYFLQSAKTNEIDYAYENYGLMELQQTQNIL
jgi:hypothetical protein